MAHHESPIAQWLESPTGIWKVMGSTPVGGSEGHGFDSRWGLGRSWVRLPLGGSENSVSKFFDLRTLLHYFTLSKSPFHLSLN